MMMMMNTFIMHGIDPGEGRRVYDAKPLFTFHRYRPSRDCRVERQEGKSDDDPGSHRPGVHVSSVTVS